MGYDDSVLKTKVVQKAEVSAVAFNHQTLFSSLFPSELRNSGMIFDLGVLIPFYVISGGIKPFSRGVLLGAKVFPY